MIAMDSGQMIDRIRWDTHIEIYCKHVMKMWSDAGGNRNVVSILWIGAPRNSVTAKFQRARVAANTKIQIEMPQPMAYTAKQKECYE